MESYNQKKNFLKWIIFIVLTLTTNNLLSQECCGQKPKAASFEFNGLDCSYSNNSQTEDDCDDFLPMQDTVYVIVNDEQDYTIGTRIFEDILVLNDILVIQDEIQLFPNTYIHVFDLEGNYIQYNRIHTSCSQPLNIGDQFGAFRLIGVVSKDGIACGDNPLGEAQFSNLFIRKKQEFHNIYFIVVYEDVLHFEVEHSLDGINFVSIDTLKPKRVYSLLYVPIEGINYYRIKAIFNDGSEPEYSNVVSEMGEKTKYRRFTHIADVRIGYFVIENDKKRIYLKRQ